MFLKEFRDLKRKPDRRLGLPDLLNFGFAEDEYTILMKDETPPGGIRNWAGSQLGQPRKARRTPFTRQSRHDSPR
jgi:hypothetical protein